MGMRRNSGTLGDRIARAIRRADNSYFFENYSKQADAVLDAISEAGFVLIHKEPTKQMIEAAGEALSYGVQSKNEMLREMYRVMIEQSLKQKR